MFTLNTRSAGPVQVEILDGAGRMVRALRVQGPTAVIDVNELLPGCYVVRVVDGSAVHSMKLLRL
ncbi:MAG: T9SS type A sorting domain-containing protein [Flavobacteriales bacterium]